MYFSIAAGLLGLSSLSGASPVAQSSAVQCPSPGISSSRAQQIRNAFSTAKITPNSIPAFDPKVEVSVAYGGKSVNLGNTFAITETVNSPTITFSAEADHDPATTKYVIVFVDFDAPMPTADGSPAALSPYLHFAAYDASPNCINPANNGGGKTLALYKSPTPLSTAQHRYTQLVYRQPAGYTPPASINYAVPALFNLNGFVSQGPLTLVGGNFFKEGATNVL